MPRYYPAFIDVKDRICVVIGGGDFGEEKVVKLLECDASVRVISTHVNESVSEMAEKGIIEWLRRTYQAGDLSDAFIAIAADNPEDVNLQIAEEATERNVPLNVVDVTHLCTFIAPSGARRGEAPGRGRTRRVVSGGKIVHISWGNSPQKCRSEIRWEGT